MSVSKRLRFEVLRRDNHACRYCGAKAPFVELQIDHVIPRTRGGGDEAWNLTAACIDCNISKGNGVPNEHVINEVRQDETSYQCSKGFEVLPCMYCSKPVQRFPDDDSDDYPQCETCNMAVSDAFTAGVRHGA